MVIPNTRPLVVCDVDGRAADVVQQNEKGYRKSLETGTLWALHTETGRLLPYGDGVAVRVEDRGTWYRAVRTNAAETPGGTPPSSRAEHAAAGNTGGAAATLSDATEIGGVLTALADLIHERRVRMPEGSYTSHLFSAGSAKIRKKTGEEAVEVILAADRAELTGEAADLIYHLLVLLEAEDIPLADLAAELKRR